MKRIVVIGAGVGGLTAAALLAKAGMARRQHFSRSICAGGGTGRDARSAVSA